MESKPRKVANSKNNIDNNFCVYIYPYKMTRRMEKLFSIENILVNKFSE